MPSGNQGRSQDQNRHNNGGERGARTAAQNAGQRVQEGAGQVGDKFREGFDTTREELGRRYRQAEMSMARNPTTSLLIGFGVGFGLGLVVTSMLDREQSWTERNVPDRLRNLPDSLQDSLEQLTDSMRNLPDAIKRYLPDSLARR